ncbi:Hypothetical predicted protein [Octopus vulgaris]|nr:Hypothetical predicted protein [Octopus vulgaris]
MTPSSMWMKVLFCSILLHLYVAQYTRSLETHSEDDSESDKRSIIDDDFKSLDPTYYPSGLDKRQQQYSKLGRNIRVIARGMDPMMFGNLGKRMDPNMFGSLGKRFNRDDREKQDKKIDPYMFGSLGKRMDPAMFGSLGKRMDPMLYGGLGKRMSPDYINYGGKRYDPMLFGGLGKRVDPMLFGGLGKKMDPNMFGTLGKRMDSMMFGHLGKRDVSGIKVTLNKYTRSGNPSLEQHGIS